MKDVRRGKCAYSRARASWSARHPILRTRWGGTKKDALLYLNGTVGCWPLNSRFNGDNLNGFFVYVYGEVVGFFFF